MKVTVELTINNETKSVHVRPADTLLNTLRDELGLTGTKPGCENGDCGACTILVDGRPMKSCLMLTVEAVGHHITTIEGLKDTPIQQAFIEKFAFQCGYCTSGFLMNCYALAELHPNADDYQIKNWLQSNICRCTGYEEIKEAITSVLEAKRDASG
ncbi:(2Fe-2S)-binding protein [Lentibacillus sp. L22]|uniref:(2Fe-2S)-binding protein n=1 Tax=Lentibacillus sp. L22 TaxID=3163028 RepID=UPI00346680D3